MMTSLLYSDKEYHLILRQVDEAFRLFGIGCTLYDISSSNMYLDDRILKQGVPYRILLQEYVDTRLLANLKWNTLDVNKESILALAPLQLCGKKYNLREFNVIRLANGDTYQVREVNSAYLLHTNYVLRLISYKDEPNRPREEKQMKTNYLVTTREEFE
jgi:hypothetical protein